MSRRRWIEWPLLALIVLVAGRFHFHALDWNDNGYPHPDERAVISQVYDMLVEDQYRPTNFTWGHFGYYSALFAYKGYIHLQYWLNGVPYPTAGRLMPVPGSVLPNFRELVTSGAIVRLGIIGIYFFCVLFLGLRWLARQRLVSAFLLLLGALFFAWLYPSLRVAMLVPVQPHYEDVCYIGRFIAAFSSMLCVPILYDLGGRLYSSRVGLLAAAFYGFCVLGIQLGHFFAVDMLQAFCAVLVIWIAAGIASAAPNPTANAEIPRDVHDWHGRVRHLNSGLLLHPVLQYILRVHHTIGWQTLLLYIALGIAIGMAMASKFSSAPIFLVPIVAHLFLIQRARAARQFAPHVFFLLCFVFALGTWFCLQPYAWEDPYTPYANAIRFPRIGERWLHVLFSAEFARQIAEQSRMVKGEGGGPWVQQFAQTVPYFTMTMQMIRWTFGWPLGAICVGGFLVTMVRNVFRPRMADLLLLSWVGIQFLTIGTFKATFPRYTMGIVPLICLFGADLCLGTRVWAVTGEGWLRRLGDVWDWCRRPLAAVGVLGGFLYCTAFMRIYDQMHTWSYASLWIFKNVPQQQPDGRQTRIIHESWDDSIPLDVPPHRVRYGSVTIAPYDNDTTAKIETLAQRLEQTDWICLPTPRLYGTTMTVPDRYPYTIRYYKMLFAGELGFTLRKTVTRFPALGSWEFNDLFADESHSVYDHPKCVLFEKTQPLTATEYYDRILNPPPAVDALTRAHLMLWRESPREQLLNIVRDPYPDDGAFTLDDLRQLASRSTELGDDRERFLAMASECGTVPCLSTSDIRAMVEPVIQVDAAAVRALRQTVVSHPNVIPGIPIRTLIARVRSLGIATDRVMDRERLVRVDRERQSRLIDSLRAYLEHTVIPRLVVLRKIDAITFDSGVVPPLTPGEQPLVSAAPARKPLITQGPRGWWVEILLVIAWYLAIQLLALAVLPFCLRLFAQLPDAGYPLAKTIGLVVVTYVVWLLVNLRLVWFTWSTCLFALLIVGAVCWTGFGRRSVGAVLAARWRCIVASEALFAFTFLFFLLIRAWNPEIYWGEKTMDFSLYNSTMRGAAFPPYEPWFSGSLLNYYYYGFILIGYPTMLTFTPTPYGFNLALGLIPALTVLCAFSILYNLSGKRRWGLLGGMFVGFIGNFDPIYRLAFNNNENLLVRIWRALGTIVSGRIFTDPIDRTMWDSFWASSRATGPGMINEFPIWSWLFADLHAHVIVMPLSLLIVALAYLAFRGRERGGLLYGTSPVAWGGVLVLAVTTGSQMACNIWDFVSYFPYLGVVLLVGALLRVSPEKNALSVRFAAFAQVRDALRPPGSIDPFVEFKRGRFVVSAALMLFFVLVWTIVWPWLCEMHPYWLGLVNRRWIGLSLALLAVAAAAGRYLLADITDRAAWRLWLILQHAVVPLATVLLLSFACFYHFHANLHTGQASIKFNNDGNILFEHAVRHFGFFALLTLAWVFMAYLVAFGRRCVHGDRSAPAPVFPLVLGIALIVVAYVALQNMGLWRPGPDQQLFGIVVYVFLAMTVFSVIVLWRRSPEFVFCGLLLLCGWGIAAISELMVIIDRMNTVFKLYHHAWMLLALGSAAAVATIRSEWMGGIVGRFRTNSMWDVFVRPVRLLAVLSFLLAFFFVLACSYRAVAGVVTRHLKTSNIPTLDGIDYLNHSEPERNLLEAVRWLNQNVAGPAVIAEAFTNQGYDYMPGDGPTSTRVCMLTGLPTLLGWPHHTKQRGHSDLEVAERARDLRQLYTTEDEAEAQAICERYDIRFLYCGYFENRMYNNPEPVLAQRAGLREVFRSSGGSDLIYEVVRGAGPAAK